MSDPACRSPYSVTGHNKCPSGAPCKQAPVKTKVTPVSDPVLLPDWRASSRNGGNYVEPCDPSRKGHVISGRFSVLGPFPSIRLAREVAAQLNDMIELGAEAERAP